MTFDEDGDGHLEFSDEIRPVMEVVKRREAIFHEIVAERGRQNEKHGGPQHDDTHSIYDWVLFMRGRLCDAAEARGAAAAGIRRRKLIQVAALAVAAIESMDRRPKE